jgi:hypothetical protein
MDEAERIAADGANHGRTGYPSPDPACMHSPRARVHYNL